MVVNGFGGKLAFLPKLAEVGIKEPGIGFDDEVGLWRGESVDFNEIVEEALDGPLRIVCERVFRSHRQAGA